MKRTSWGILYNPTGVTKKHTEILCKVKKQSVAKLRLISLLCVLAYHIYTHASLYTYVFICTHNMHNNIHIYMPVYTYICTMNGKAIFCNF